MFISVPTCLPIQISILIGCRSEMGLSASNSQGSKHRSICFQSTFQEGCPHMQSPPHSIRGPAQVTIMSPIGPAVCPPAPGDFLLPVSSESAHLACLSQPALLLSLPSVTPTRPHSSSFPSWLMVPGQCCRTWSQEAPDGPKASLVWQSVVFPRCHPLRGPGSSMCLVNQGQEELCALRHLPGPSP